MPVEPAFPLVREIIGHAEVEPVLVLKPAARGQVLRCAVAKVPLSREGRRVARLGQRLGQRPLRERQPVPRARFDLPELQSEPHRVQARHQRGAGRSAHRLHIELFQLHALRCQPVDVRRPDFRTMVTDVLPAEIVGEDEHDIRPERFRGPARLAAGERQDERERKPAEADRGLASHVHGAGERVTATVSRSAGPEAGAAGSSALSRPAQLGEW